MDQLVIEPLTDAAYRLPDGLFSCSVERQPMRVPES